MLTCNVGLLSGVGKWALISIRHPQIPRPWNPIRASQESDIVIPEGPSKGETMSMCMWPIGEQDMVSISVIRAPQGAQHEAGLAQLNKTFDMLKAQGWTEERKDFSNTRCAIMAPPSSLQDVPLS